MLRRKSVSFLACLSCLALVFLSAAPVFAERNDDHLVGAVGAYKPSSKVLSGATGVYFSAAYGKWLFDKYTHNLGAEVEFSTSEASGSSTLVASVDGFRRNISIDTKIQYYAGLATLKYGKTFGNMEFILGGGGGFYMTKMDVAAYNLDGAPFKSRATQDSVSFGGHAKTAITYNFPSGLLLGVEGKYMWVGTTFAKTLTGDANVQLSGDVSMNGYAAAALIGYQW